MNKILLVLKKEIREIFRDKKSLSMMLVIPIIMPLLLIGLCYLFEIEQKENPEKEYNIGFNYQLDEIEKEIITNLNINSKNKNIKELYEKGDINAYIEKENNNYYINYDENNPESLETMAKATSYLEQYKLYLQNNYLIDKNINPDEVINIIKINYNTLNKKNDNFYINYITSYAFLFIIMAITISATYPATDTTAGEKERGTLETLLTYPIKSKDIIIGKFLSVSLSSMVTGILSFILTTLAFIYISNNISLFKDLSIIPNIKQATITLLIIISYSLLISGLCISIASLSKSFKEAQSKLTPLTFISVFPGMITFLADIKTNFLISITPFINYIQIYNNINKNNYNYLYIISMFISTILLITIVLYIIIKQYKSEKVLFN